MSKIGCFIISRPRTGGTLLASMLNAHSQMSFCYEIFPNLLLRADGSAFCPDHLLSRLKAFGDLATSDVIMALERDNFRVLLARAHRSGLEAADIKAELFNFEGSSFSSETQRFCFVEALMRRQGAKDGVPIVGTKMQVSPQILLERHSDATFLMMVRDGRDMFASRKTKGNFRQKPEETADDWVASLAHFRNFYLGRTTKARFVKYETLVTNPREELEKISALIGVEYEDSMVRFEQFPQTLFTNPYGHLSVEQLKVGLSATSVGKWRSILTTKEVEEFEDIAREFLEEFGYL